MASDLSIKLENKPGALAGLGQVLGDAGINIDGIAGAGDGEAGTVHILVQDAGAARDALTAAGLECGPDREVEVISIVDQPGEMGRHLRRVADAGVNVDLLYLATGTRLVIGSSDQDGLRGALHGQ
jgi:hypothetical protein